MAVDILPDFVLDIPQKNEIHSLATLLSQLFIHPFEEMENIIAGIGTDNFRILRHNEKIIACLGILELGQWCGGRTVPAAGITKLGVSPEYRGKGIASYLLKKTLEKLHSNHIPLSILYPTTHSLYRKLDYERAGEKLTYRLSTVNINMQDRGLDIIQAERSAFNNIKEIYALQAKHNSGNLDRSSFFWEKILNPIGMITHKYMVTRNGKAEGYVVFIQGKRGEPIRILDICAHTRDAGSCLLTFFADHCTISKAVVWDGGPQDFLLYLLPEPDYEIIGTKKWSMRIVDVAEALRLRGYPKNIETEIHFKVTDDLFAWNNRTFVLKISNGTPHVRKGGRGNVSVTIDGFSPLYTGHLGSHKLMKLGYLKASKHVLETLDSVFSVNQPWMPDYF